MTREQWRAVWRWMRVEKKRLAWEMGVIYPEAPVVIDWAEASRAYLNAPMPPIRKLGSFPIT